jgi:hypothetical protein
VVRDDRDRWSLRDWKAPLLRKMDGEGWDALPLAIRRRKKLDRGHLRYAPWVAPVCGILTLLGLVLWSLMG